MEKSHKVLSIGRLHEMCCSVKNPELGVTMCSRSAFTCMHHKLNDKKERAGEHSVQSKGEES